MFDLLPESTRTRQRSVWQTGTSIGVHALIITGAVWATRADLVNAEARTVVPVIMVPVDERTVDADRSQPDNAEPAIEARPAPVIPIVTNVPLQVPPVSTDAPPFDPADYDGHGRPGEVMTGVTFPPDSAGTRSIVITSAEADEAPSLLRAGPKVIPPGLAGVAAHVKLQFVIDVNGRVEPQSVKVLETSSDAFDDAARQMVLQSVYRPGRRQGETVRVLVQQGVGFTGED
ncbi:MAG TPA: energy transducer TonB [Gemmatimonadales bacterium]|jgi:protein TonB|nr:energy transducer TonB [Gemmatimonadales bacterium]